MREWVDSDIKQPHQLSEAARQRNHKNIGKWLFHGRKAGASPPLSTRPRKHTHVMLRSPPYLSRRRGAVVVRSGKILK